MQPPEDPNIDGFIHVCPMHNAEPKHNLHHTCWCKPVQTSICKENGRPVYQHRVQNMTESFGGWRETELELREKLETAELLAIETREKFSEEA